MATAATSEAVKQVTGSLSWEQPIHHMEGHDGHLTPQSHELESVNHGIGKDTPQTAYTQMQSNGFSQMFESLQLKPQICEETKDCIPKPKNDKENIYYVCCWVPGNSEGEQHCVQNVLKPLALFLKLKFTPPKRHLGDVRRQRNTFHKSHLRCWYFQWGRETVWQCTVLMAI